MRYFAVGVIGHPEYDRTEFASTAGAAKYKMLRSLWDAWDREAVSFKHLWARVSTPREKPPIAARYFKGGGLRSEVVARLVAFLDGHVFTREQWEANYPRWAEGGDAWMISCMGGTSIMQALMWYHHVHQPGSLPETWAGVILGALIAATEPEGGVA